MKLPDQEMSEETAVAPRRRWPGVILSMLVPGFGLVRAGRPYRGIAWFVAMILLGFLVATGAALSVVPVWVAAGLWLGAAVAVIWMLCDSFRPGKMTLPLWLLLGGFFTIILIFPSPARFVARAFKVPTSSMEPTLLGPKQHSPPDHLIADRLSYRFSDPRRGDLIVFPASKVPGLANSGLPEREAFFVVRIVGMPGERIRIADGKVSANGRLLGESDGIPPLSYSESAGGASTTKREGADFVVGPKEYFVLGDNSAQSYDSRHWGCVPASAVYGKISMIYYPFERMRRIGSW